MALTDGARRYVFRAAIAWFVVVVGLWAANARIFSHLIPRPGVGVALGGLAMGCTADDEAIHFRVVSLERPEFGGPMIRFGGNPTNYSCDGAHYAANVFGVRAMAMPEKYHCTCYSQPPFALVGLPYWLLLAVSGGLIVATSPPLRSQFLLWRSLTVPALILGLAAAMLDFASDGTGKGRLIRLDLHASYRVAYEDRAPDDRRRDFIELGRVSNRALDWTCGAFVFALACAATVRYVRFLATDDATAASSADTSASSPTKPNA